MKKIFLKSLSWIGTLFPLSFLLKISKKKVICLLYHTVNDKAPAHIRQLYRPRTWGQFKADLDFLSLHFNFISSEQLASGEFRSEKQCLHLSFDDGLRECYEIIYPELLKRNIPATFFINPAFTDNLDMFHCHKGSILKEAFLKRPRPLKDADGNRVTASYFTRTVISENDQGTGYYDKFAEQLNVNFKKYLDVNRPYLTRRELHLLNNDGYCIGNHTMNHPLLNSLQDSRKIEQVLLCADWLVNERLGSEKYFAFPFHDIGIKMNFFNCIHENGIILSFGTSDMKEEVFKNHFHRIHFENSGLPAKSLLKKFLFKYLLLKAVNKNYITRN